MQSIAVKYENGVFTPLEPVAGLAEGVIGEVHIEESDKVEAIKASPFFGLWKNREDIEDGVSYVCKLRNLKRYER